MSGYPNPIAGPIHPAGWQRPPGNTDFRLTKDAAAHVASGGPKAIDIGDGDPDQDNVLAMAAGRVTLVRDSDGVIHHDLADGTRIVYAHLRLPHIVTVGQAVVVGQVIGHVSNTYPPPTVLAPHLHLQIGKVGSNTAWEDPWPLLAQNQEDEVVEATVTPWNGPRTATIAAGKRVLGYDYHKLVKEQTWPAGSSFTSDAQVLLVQQPPKAPSGTFYRAVDGFYAGLLIPRSQVTLSPDAKVYSEAEKSAAVKDAANSVALAAAQKAGGY